MSTISICRTGIRSLFVLICFLGVSESQDLCQPVGWATQNGGVTGGGNATPVTVSTYDALKSNLTSRDVKVVYVSGTIMIPAGGRITIQDQKDKTIIGLAGSKLVSADQTKDGSGIFYIKRCSNFIISNLVFEGPGAYDTDGYDNLCIDNCQNFWVDHCEFHDGVDGNFDIKNMSDFISITWCTFSYEKPPKAGGSGGSADHRYTNLIGSSDGATGDEGKLNVTFNYCWWGEGCRERMPRVRFGKVHMVNNYFSSSVSNHCIRAGYKAEILAEGNFFLNQKLPIDEFDGNYSGIKAMNNIGASNMNKGKVFTPPYTIAVAKPEEIVTPIKNCAGAKLSDPTECSSCSDENINKSPSINLTAPINNSSFYLPVSITITADATDSDGTISFVEFYNGSILLGSDNSSPYSYTWENVAAGSYTITAKATDNKGASSTSDPVTVTVFDPAVPTLIVTDNSNQSVKAGSPIDPIVFTWGGAATDISYTALPDGLVAAENISNKTLTISGTPLSAGTFSVATIGGSPEVTIDASITINVPGKVLADWYAFQEDPIKLNFLAFTNASISTSYFDQSKPSHGVSYTAGALRLNPTGILTLTLKSLDVLKFRFYATGERTLKITYGPAGTEKTWNSPSQYESGAHELDLTSIISDLKSSTPTIINIINSRADGGTLNIHDLYVEGSADQNTGMNLSTRTANIYKSIIFKKIGNTLIFTNKSTLSPKQNVIIFDLLGNVVLNKPFSPAIDINEMNDGLYLLRVGNYSSRFIKK